jgi:hypothetical protein
MPWGIAAAVVGGVIASNASSKASKAQAQSAREAGDVSERQYDQTREDQLRIYEQQRADQAPYREAGVKSLAELMNSTAPGGQFSKNYERSAFEVDPGYQFRLDQGEQGINRAAAARGGWNSGATLKALARFNSNLGSQEYGAWDQRQNTREAQFNANRDFRRNNLASLAGVGQTATTATGNAGSNAYGTIANAGNQNAQLQGQALQNAGEARASGYVGTANAIGSGIKSAYDNYQQDQFIKKYTPPPRAGSTGGGDGGEYLGYWNGGG